MLSIQNLHVSVGEKPILNGINLVVHPGEIHAIMGPNGSGKSTLAYVLMGHPNYQIRNSKFEIRNKSNFKNSKINTHVLLNGKDLLTLTTDERARAGLFLAFQMPVGVPGVTVKKMLRSINAKSDVRISKQSDGTKSKQAQKSPKNLQEIIAVNREIDKLADALSVKPELLNRSLNDDFSGGEKKKIETLQMLFLKPKYAIVDEVDTGLDVDALKVVAKGIKALAQQGSGIIIITHYQRILKHVRPNKVHVMREGKIVKTGNASLAKEIEKHGYSTI